MIFRSVLGWLATPVFWLWVALIVGLRWIVRGLIAIALVLFFGNAIFNSARDVAFRALDPAEGVCVSAGDPGMDELARDPAPDYVTNDELAAIRRFGPVVRDKLSCSIQRHIVPGYKSANGTTRSLSYDLAFVEFQEDGRPYAVLRPCTAPSTNCVTQGGATVQENPDKSQLGALISHLNPSNGPHYVIAFIHGWRHNAALGDANVGNLRHYAAHVARFLADRADADPSRPAPKVTAVYVGWRGARTDENWLTHKFGEFGHRFGDLGAAIGATLGAATLFDRKPVSEAIAPAALAGLRAIEQTLGLTSALPSPDATPPPQKNHMIVFGHSLGGNLLATALKDDLIKKVMTHKATTYMLPVLGDVVVLINPASEATKWTDVQRAVWDQTASAGSERRPLNDYVASHYVFRADQRPLVVSVTAARDWPPGGRRIFDCVSIQPTAVAAGSGAPSKGVTTDDIGLASVKAQESQELVREPLYDWATYDMFPLFKWDFRPVSDTIERIATGRDPHDDCATRVLPWWRLPLAWFGSGFADLMRVLPFQETDPEQTRTIGNFDPPRAPRGRLQDYYASAKPFGTTHEMRGRGKDDVPRKRSERRPGSLRREIPVDYEQVLSAAAACPSAQAWLSTARDATAQRYQGSHGTYWNSDDAGDHAPALQIVHGFTLGGVAAITRANDPFWNIRAFDTALARHDGYMLSSFICAMNQLVMDDVTKYLPPGAAAAPVQ